MDKHEILAAASKVFGKDKFNQFKSILDKDLKTSLAACRSLASTEYNKAKSDVLDSVYKDECDFVIMSHYRHSKDLYYMIK